MRDIHYQLKISCLFYCLVPNASSEINETCFIVFKQMLLNAVYVYQELNIKKHAKR